MSEPRFVGLHDLARRLGLTDTWIKKNAKRGLIPSVRDGHKLKFPIPEAYEAAVELAKPHEVVA